MFKHWLELAHNYDNEYLNWLFQYFSSEGVNFHNVCQWQRFTLEELFKSLFTEL